MINIYQLSAKLQNDVSKQLMAENNISSNNVLNPSETQKLLKQILIIKEGDRKQRKSKLMASNQLQFEYLTEPRQIKFQHHLWKEHNFEKTYMNSVDISLKKNQTWKLQKEMRHSLNLKELHKLDESIAIDILNRTCGNTDTNFYNNNNRNLTSRRRVRSQQVKMRESINLFCSPLQTPKTKNRINKTIGNMNESKNQIKYKLPVSNIGIPIIKTQRSFRKTKQHQHPFSIMNNFNYSKLHKSLWVSNQ